MPAIISQFLSIPVIAEFFGDEELSTFRIVNDEVKIKRKLKNTNTFFIVKKLGVVAYSLSGFRQFRIKVNLSINSLCQSISQIIEEKQPLPPADKGCCTAVFLFAYSV